MEIDNYLIMDILKELKKIYPNAVDSFKQILLEHKNRQELMGHLVYCKDEEWVTFKEIRQDQVVDIPVDCKYIKITSLGLRYIQRLPL